MGLEKESEGDCVVKARINTEKCTSFAEIRKEGYEIFSVGPIYVYAHLTESLITAFAKDTSVAKPMQVENSLLAFDRSIICPCGWWSSRLEIMDAVNYSYFRAWIRKWVFLDKERHKVYAVSGCAAPLLDPIMLAAGKNPTPETVDIYLLHTPSWSLTLKTAAKGVTGITYAEAPAAVELMFSKPVDHMKEIVASLQDHLKGD